MIFMISYTSNENIYGAIFDTLDYVKASSEIKALKKWIDMNGNEEKGIFSVEKMCKTQYGYEKTGSKKYYWIKDKMLQVI